MNLLGIDTATEACTVGLQLGSERFEKISLEHHHAGRILGEIEALLAEHGASLKDIDAVVWGRGPGMFTGLRIGAGVAQGIAYAIDRPVVCVSTLAVIAAGQEQQYVLAAIDARMDQVYWAPYRNTEDGPLALGDEQVGDPATVGAGLEGVFTGAGSGWDRYHEAILAANAGRVDGWTPDQYPCGNVLLSLGETEFTAGRIVHATAIQPVYVRDKVARKTSER